MQGFLQTLLNIFCNFIPHKTETFGYKTPEWINKSSRLSLKKRTKLTKKYHKVNIIPQLVITRR